MDGEQKQCRPQGCGDHQIIIKVKEYIFRGQRLFVRISFMGFSVIVIRSNDCISILSPRMTNCSHNEDRRKTRGGRSWESGKAARKNV